MKIRTGFVSNSSSSSFVIKKDKLTRDQIYMIQNHIAVAKKIDEAVKPLISNGGRGHRRIGDWKYVPKTAEQIEKEKNEPKTCNHPEAVECADCNRIIDPYKEIWDENIITGLYRADENDAWEITETGSEIHGYTSMNNFDMNVFLKEIGVVNSPDCEEN